MYSISLHHGRGRLRLPLRLDLAAEVLSEGTAAALRLSLLSLDGVDGVAGCSRCSLRPPDCGVFWPEPTESNQN